jgi:hypothetical protein
VAVVNRVSLSWHLGCTGLRWQLDHWYPAGNYNTGPTEYPALPVRDEDDGQGLNSGHTCKACLTILGELSEGMLGRESTQPCVN